MYKWYRKNSTKNGGCHKDGFSEDHVWETRKNWFYTHEKFVIFFGGR
jgi:hypothetical protein